MTDPADRREADHGRLTLLGAAVLAGVLATAIAAALAWGAGRPRWPHAVAFAAAIAGVSGLGGWLAARRRPADPALAVAGVLAAATLRLVLPLAALAWLSGPGKTLRDAGAGGLVVAFYLALLAAAISLHIMWEPRRRSAG